MHHLAVITPKGVGFTADMSSLASRVLSAAILVCAILNLRAVFADATEQEYLFKPLTTLLTIALAATVPGERGRYRWLIVAGLICSLAGDVWLMLPGDRFIPGLASFLLAHLCYIAAFTRGGWRASPSPAVVCGGYLMLLLWWLLPYAGEVRVPVAAYSLVICTMAWQAIERWRVEGSTSSALAALGAVLFVVSDSALAVNRFLSPFALERLVVMGTYVPAQWLIALSCGNRAHSSVHPDGASLARA
jgi:uncharacterized membrane protein YhhN